MDLTQLLEAMIDQGAGDLHLQAGAPPMLRIGGDLTPAQPEPLGDDWIRETMSQMAPEDSQIQLDRDRSADF
ncbi:MAG: twitching motility protein PilT, partial [Planctomycetota bacterium]